MIVGDKAKGGSDTKHRRRIGSSTSPDARFQADPEAIGERVREIRARNMSGNQHITWLCDQIDALLADRKTLIEDAALLTGIREQRDEAMRQRAAFRSILGEILAIVRNRADAVEGPPLEEDASNAAGTRPRPFRGATE